MDLSYLNKLNDNAKITSNKECFSFRDFNSDEELSIHSDIKMNLILLYQQIFRDSGAWGEDYEVTEIEKSIKAGLSGDACLRVCFDANDGLQPIGFCWAQKLSIDSVLKSVESIQFYKKIGSPNVHEPLKTLIGSSEIVYIHDLGISPDYRGEVPLERLVIPPVMRVVTESSAKRVLFWSNPQTCIHHLANKAQIPMIYEQSGMQFFLLDVMKEHIQMASHIN